MWLRFLRHLRFFDYRTNAATIRKFSGRCGRLLLTQRQSEIAPAVKTSGERANADDPLFLKFARQTGAGGFVRSSAVQDDIPIARNTIDVCLQIIRRNANCAWHSPRVGEEVQWMAKVYYVGRGASLNLVMKFLRFDA